MAEAIYDIALKTAQVRLSPFLQSPQGTAEWSHAIKPARIRLSPSVFLSEEKNAGFFETIVYPIAL